MNLTIPAGNYTSIIDVMNFANAESDGWLGIMIMIFVFVISFTTLNGFQTKNSVPAIMFVMVIVNSILNILGLLSGLWVSVSLFGLVLSLMWAWISD